MQKALLGTLILAATVATGPRSGVAQNYPWCVVNDQTGTTSCRFVSREQCLASTGGNVGHCVANPASPSVPAPVRGFQHNLDELKTWYEGMVASSSEKGFGQRDEQNWSWVNQSIIAVTHRLTRPVNYNQDDPAKPVRTMNLVDISFKAANWIVLAISLAIGLGFVAVMPARSKTTPRSNAEELGILFCLMTVASPLARQYYFMWLFFPITILMHRAAYDPRLAVRMGTWATLATAGLLMCLSFPVFPKDLQAYGNNLAATAVIAGALVWHMLHPPWESETKSLSPAQPKSDMQGNTS